MASGGVDSGGVVGSASLVTVRGKGLGDAGSLRDEVASVAGCIAAGAQAASNETKMRRVMKEKSRR